MSLICRDSLDFVIYFWSFLSRVISWLCNGQTFFGTVCFWTVFKLVKALIAKFGGGGFFNDLGLLGRCHFWGLEDCTQLTVNISCRLSYLKNRLHQSWSLGSVSIDFLSVSSQMPYLLIIFSVLPTTIPCSFECVSFNCFSPCLRQEVIFVSLRPVFHQPGSFLTAWAELSSRGPIFLGVSLWLIAQLSCPLADQDTAVGVWVAVQCWAPLIMQ